MIVEECTPYHIQSMIDFGRQEGYRDLIEVGPFIERIRSGPCEAGIIDGRVVVCAGVVPVSRHRATAWALVSATNPEYFFSIHRAAKKFLDFQPYRRIEAEVDLEFKEALRWVKMLGFKEEAPRMKHYLPDGRDAALYALIKD